MLCYICMHLKQEKRAKAPNFFSWKVGVVAFSPASSKYMT